MSTVTVIVAAVVCKPTDRSAETHDQTGDLQIFNLTLSTELSRLLFVTIEDVEHEEDLRRIGPLKAVVLCHRAVNCHKKRKTAEVTICILSEGLPDRPSTVTALLVNGPEHFKQATCHTGVQEPSGTPNVFWPAVPRNVRRLEAPTLE